MLTEDEEQELADLMDDWHGHNWGECTCSWCERIRELFEKENEK